MKDFPDEKQRPLTSPEQTNDELLPLIEKLTAAKAEIERLKKDKERIDWLDGQAWTNGECDRQISYDFRGDLRKAIDKAMPPKYCPKCKSKKIAWSSEGSEYYCHTCHHHF